MMEEVSILLVEDDNSLRSILTQMLGVYYQVVSAQNLEMARKIIANQDIDLVLLDKSLPDGSGLSLIPTINCKNLEIATIIITGDEDLLSVSKAISNGADDYVIKSESMIRDLMVRIPVAIKHAKLRAFAHQSKNANTYILPTTEIDLQYENYRKFLASIEKNYFVRALQICNGDTFKLADTMGISRSTLFRKFSELDISIRELQPLGMLDAK